MHASALYKSLRHMPAAAGRARQKLMAHATGTVCSCLKIVVGCGQRVDVLGLLRVSPVVYDVLHDGGHDVPLRAQVRVLLREAAARDLRLQLQPDEVLQLVLPHLLLATYL